MNKDNNQNKILELFFEEPLKQFKFKDITQKIDLHKDNINNWLIKLQNDNLIKKIKPKGKFPFYVSDYNNPNFQNRKKLYALSKLYEIGLLNELVSLKNAKTIILFGSYSRSDWHKNSDIDLFIYGDISKIDLNKFEKKLNKEIEIFSIKSKQDLKKMNPHLLNNIISGYYVKGDLSFLGANKNECGDSLSKMSI